MNLSEGYTQSSFNSSFNFPTDFKFCEIKERGKTNYPQRILTTKRGSGIGKNTEEEKNIYQKKEVSG